MRKRLVVCFDGTWNAADSTRAETNVSRLARAIRGSSGDLPQLVLYLRGVGTSGTGVQKLLAGATGEGVEETIRSAYMFLAQNYLPRRLDDGAWVEADEIYLFGFSRGAFSARSLAGFLSASGLLHRQSLGRINDAWTYYRKDDIREPEDFVQRHPGIRVHTDVGVTFLGVWDTVGALGVPSGILREFLGDLHAFHNTAPSRIVRRAAHALAIDEWRDEFVPTLWTGDLPKDSVIEQVWFAGSHADVGGGYSDRELADIPLRWMAGRAMEAGLSLDEDPSLLPPVTSMNPLAATHDSSSGVFAFDRLRPTFRSVLGQVPKSILAFERLYRLFDRDGAPTRVVNEMIHESVLQRWGRRALFSPTDEPEARQIVEYSPKNLEPLFDAKGNLRRTFAARVARN